MKRTSTPACLRLRNQGISSGGNSSPAEAAAMLGALQAQDYLGAKWSIGLRVPGATQADVDRAVDSGEIVRTWLMRGTLHIASAGDVGWMLDLLTPRLVAGSASRDKALGLDGAAFRKAAKLFRGALGGGNRISREGVYALLEKGGIRTDAQRGYHLLWRAAMDRVVCFGPPEGNRQTFVLLDDWVSTGRNLDAGRAAERLAFLYFSSRGPATLRDFVWWSGLTVKEAAAGLEAAGPRLVEGTLGAASCWGPKGAASCKDAAENVHLLPGFDEYLLGYRDRSAALSPDDSERVCPGKNGMFLSTVVAKGRVVGVWRKSTKKNDVRIEPEFFTGSVRPSAAALGKAAERYGRFIGRTVSVAAEPRGGKRALSVDG